MRAASRSTRLAAIWSAVSVAGPAVCTLGPLAAALPCDLDGAEGGAAAPAFFLAASSSSLRCHAQPTSCSTGSVVVSERPQQWHAVLPPQVACLRSAARQPSRWHVRSRADAPPFPIAVPLPPLPFPPPLPFFWEACTPARYPSSIARSAAFVDGQPLLPALHPMAPHAIVVRVDEGLQTT